MKHEKRQIAYVLSNLNEKSHRNVKESNNSGGWTVYDIRSTLVQNFEFWQKRKYSRYFYYVYLICTK